jgi:hypothetical protein
VYCRPRLREKIDLCADLRSLKFCVLYRSYRHRRCDFQRAPGACGPEPMRTLASQRAHDIEPLLFEERRYRGADRLAASICTRRGYCEAPGRIEPRLASETVTGPRTTQAALRACLSHLAPDNSSSNNITPGRPGGTATGPPAHCLAQRTGSRPAGRMSLRDFREMEFADERLRTC